MNDLRGRELYDLHVEITVETADNSVHNLIVASNLKTEQHKDKQTTFYTPEKHVTKVYKRLFAYNYLLKTIQHSKVISPFVSQ